MEIEKQELHKAEIEKRKYRRAALITHVKCEALGREDIAVSRDVSVGGMFLNMTDPYPKGSAVLLAFRLTPTEPLLNCQGEVVYSLKGIGMGTMFTQVADDVRQALDRFVAEAN